MSVRWTWPEVDAWRRSKRAELLTRRQQVPGDRRVRIRDAVVDGLQELMPDLLTNCVGFYWPFKGEIDLRGMLATGARAALPVVVQKNEPLEFWCWSQGMELRRGVWDIPIPAQRSVVRPSVLLVALLGFDASGYRLGYGGGYYDRTLAAMEPKPLTVGVGYEMGRLETIHPQHHDIAMDAIVTEAGGRWIGDRGERRVSPGSMPLDLFR